LQALDFAQNVQRNLWQYLEKKGKNLEMFGAGWEKLAEPDGRQREKASRRAHRPCACVTRPDGIASDVIPAKAGIQAWRPMRLFPAGFPLSRE